MFDDADAVIARIDDDVQRAEARAAALPKLQEQVAQLRSTAYSLRRDIAVEIGSDGTVRDIRLSDAALDRDSNDLSRELLAVINKASADVRRNVVEITAEVMGKDDPVVRLVSDNLGIHPDDDADASSDRGV